MRRATTKNRDSVELYLVLNFSIVVFQLVYFFRVPNFEVPFEANFFLPEELYNIENVGAKFLRYIIERIMYFDSENI